MRKIQTSMLVLEYMHTILIGNKKSKLVGHDQEDTHTHTLAKAH